MYDNTNLNLIPLISGGKSKVYVLTGPNKSGMVVFGNDYLLTFDDQKQFVSTRPLHRNVIINEYGQQNKDGQIAIGGMHNHSAETGSYITATDICTLMLYAKFAKWEQYTVVSQDYLSIWNCETNTLILSPMKAKK